jgi:hypothetical protein
MLVGKISLTEHTKITEGIISPAGAGKRIGFKVQGSGFKAKDRKSHHRGTQSVIYHLDCR